MITKALKDMRQIFGDFWLKRRLRLLSSRFQKDLHDLSTWVSWEKKSSKHSYEKKTAHKLYIVGENS